MGDGVELHPAFPHVEQSMFKACGVIDFFMGDPRGHVGGNADAPCAAGDGIEAFFKLSGGAKASGYLGCGGLVDEGNGLQDSQEQPDAGELDWASPRISFSQDLTVGAFEVVSAFPGSPKALSEKMIWKGGGGGDPDGYSSEFEFLNNGIGHDSFAHEEKCFMLPADKLFSEGKLVPLHTSQKTDSTPSCTGHGMPQECDHTHETSKKPIARHLSFDQPKASSSSFTCDLDPLVRSVDNSPCSSPPRPKPTPMTAEVGPTAPALQKGSAKHSFKIKDLFKPKRVNSTSTQLTRDNSITSTCRIPMPPRSFWPFSRSNSAGESKTTTPLPPTLPQRSNSTGENNTGRASPACKNSSQADNAGECCVLSTGHGQDPMASSCEKSTSDGICDAQVDGTRLKEVVGTSSRQVDSGDESTNITVNNVVDARRSNSSTKGKTLGVSPGRRRYMSTTSNFLRGSPGRRGRFSSPAKVNAGRIMLKNLERCSAERKLYRESLGRRAVYPVAVRVTPVLNVAVYRGGKLPTNGMFGLGSLFSKKEKAREKPMEGAMNNWRVDA